jgi:hypothetical protein
MAQREHVQTLSRNSNSVQDKLYDDILLLYPQSTIFQHSCNSIIKKLMNSVESYHFQQLMFKKTLKYYVNHNYLD